MVLKMSAKKNSLMAHNSNLYDFFHSFRKKNNTFMWQPEKLHDFHS